MKGPDTEYGSGLTVCVMEKNVKKRSPIRYILFALFLVFCAAVIAAFYTFSLRFALNDTAVFAETDAVLSSPLTGFAPTARNEEACEDSQLVFILITWAEWEPTEGNYNIAAMEEKFHIARWKAENKHAVLRFVCDYPGAAPHLDIPDWLYARTQDGDFYEISSGKGYSPNYGNDYFRERHALAIKALADYCNQDSFVAYVELGSLGHWGEWHTSSSQGVSLLPDADVCRAYVLDYAENFTNARLLTRRNYAIAVEEGIGQYNDMVGHVDSTQTWLGWLAEGGSYTTAGDPLEFTPVQNFWEVAPTGGELTSSYPMEELLGQRFSETLETVEQGHLTFIGPNCPVKERAESDAAVQLRERLGYRLYISELRTEYVLFDNGLDVYLTWNNMGLAPLYWDFPVTLYVYDLGGEQIYSQELSDLKLSALAPDKTITTAAQIPYMDTLREGFSIGVSVLSPDGRDDVRLAMESEIYDEHVQMIYTYEGEANQAD